VRVAPTMHRQNQRTINALLRHVMPPFFGPGLCDSHGCLWAVLWLSGVCV
jgi:hypothetical protein